MFGLIAKKSPLSTWQRWHSVLVVLISGLFIGLTVWDWFSNLYYAWLFSMTVLVALILIVGHGVTGVWKGAFVDDTLRMSLSRFQLFIWTSMIVAALGVIAVERAETDPNSALSIKVPETIWALLGISTTSLIGAPLIKKTKEEAPTDQQVAAAMLTQRAGADPKDPVDHKGAVATYRSIDQASVADMFMGDWVDNFNLLDVSKIQLFLFTGLLSLAYGHAIAEQLRAAAPNLAALPNIGGELLPLLGISHAGYLMGKVATAPDLAPRNGAV